MSWGYSQAGYDCRIAQDLIIYPRTLWYMLLNAIGFHRPHFCLASTIEYFHIPNWIMAKVLDKSSWARQGLVAQTTCLEPGWYGNITLELSNESDKIIRLTNGQPIVQIVFHTLAEPTLKPYEGKYNNQMGITPVIFE